MDARPDDITDLFIGGGPYPGWQAFNWKRRRFYVLNTRMVLGLLRAEPTKATPYLRAAEVLIRTTTAWPRQYKADYSASRVQIYPEQVNAPKLLEKAAAIIVALELMARDSDPTLNVYDLLRIAPAYYFLDEFDRDKLRALTGAYRELDDQARAELRQPFMRPHEIRSAGEFSETCMGALGQPAGSTLLRELADGHCATLAVVEGLSAFIGRAFGNAFSVGPCRCAGEPGTYRPGLGEKDAAPSLVAPHFAPATRRDDTD